jgi:cytochrome c5
VDPFASMPAFGGALTADEMNALVDYLSRRK